MLTAELLLCYTKWQVVEEAMGWMRGASAKTSPQLRIHQDISRHTPTGARSDRKMIPTSYARLTLKRKMEITLFLSILLLYGCRNIQEQSPEVTARAPEATIVNPTSTATHVPSPASTATRIPGPTGTSVAVPVANVTRTPVAGEPALKRVTIPYWLSIGHPESWFPVTGGAEGALAYSTHQIPLDPKELPEDGALFFIFYQQPDSPDPLSELQAFAETLNDDTELWIGPERLTGVGEAAATMTYSWLGWEDRVFVSNVTGVMDDQGRMAMLWATSEEQQWATFAGHFTRMRNSLAFEEMMPAPELTTDASALAELISYRHAPLQVELAYPDDWSPFVVEDLSLQLVPQESMTQSALNMFIVSAAPAAADVRQGAEALLETANADFAGAAPASPPTVNTVDGQQVALQYFVTVFEQEPLLLLLAGVTRDEHGIVAMSFIRDEAYRDEMEAIASTMVINPSLQGASANFTVDWSPDGEYLAYTSRDEELGSIYTLQLSDGARQRLTDETEPASYADWSPAGDQIIYNVKEETGRHLFLRHLSGGNRRQLTDAPDTEDSYPDWSPDGSKVVFARYDHPSIEGEDVDAEIYLLDLEEGSARSLNVRGTSPAFSPDGNRITFVSDLNGAQDLYVMNADGSNIVQVTDDPNFDLWPAWSPDGDRLAFASERDGNFDIYVVNVDGSNQQRLTDHPAADYAPAWSPDGTSIAFDSNREGVLSIYIMDADGSNLTPLADSSH